MKVSAWRFPAVIVTTEKNDSRYLDATSEAAFHRSALSLLRERFESGDYYPEVEPEENAPPVDLDDEAIAALPPGSGVLRLHEQQVSTRNEWLRERSSYFRWYQHVRSALEREDGALAWRCLESRDPYEYEGVRLEKLEGYDPGTEESRRRLLEAVATKAAVVFPADLCARSLRLVIWSAIGNLTDAAQKIEDEGGDPVAARALIELKKQLERLHGLLGRSIFPMLPKGATAP